jgi:hypothetical protein
VILLTAYFSILFVGINLILFITLHFYNKEYSITRNAVSDYAVGKSATLFLIYIIISMLAYALLALSIYSSNFKLYSINSLVLLILIIIFRIGLSIFKTDIEGQKLTRNGILHYIFAILSFAALYTFVDSSITDLKNKNVFTYYQIYFSYFKLIYTIILVLVCITLIPKLRKIFGLFERLFLILGSCWIGLLCILQILLENNIT